MENAFALQSTEQEYMKIIQTKPILIIVDDVATTGATLLSAANAFPIQSNIQIWGAALARG
jgi:predicted amidophosphoribosyltransferase